MAGDPLLNLLAECVVPVERDGEFTGTGFWVAPGELLTCAHVAHGGLPLTAASLPAEPASPLLAPDDPAAAEFYPQPDVALLHVPDAPPGHPCVRLDRAVPAVGDQLQLMAFNDREYVQGRVVRSGATLHLETLFEHDGVTLFKLREGQVVGGFSGGPLLHRPSGTVRALVESSRDVDATLGGFGVPAALFEQVAPGVLDRNAAFHAADRRWADAVEQQRVAAAERAGARAALPLLPPVVELDWTVDDPPSELLQARYAVVPFVPRGDLLEQVMRWRESDAGLALLVLTGAGGFGKTRTAVEICRAAQEARWTAGHLVVDPGPGGMDGLDDLLTWPGRLLVAVDYAETRPDLVARLLTRLRRRTAATRVVLVVRQGGGRDALTRLFATGDAADDLARLMRRAELYGLGVGERELDRRALFRAAATRFAELLGRASTPTPDLYAEHFARPLLVVAAALLTVTNPEMDVATLTAEQLLSEVLDRHETHYWRRTATRRGLDLDDEDRPVAVALAALCGLHDDADNGALVGLVPGIGDDAALRTRVVRWLRDLYGPTGVLEPDLLAEVLVTRELRATPALVTAVLDAVDDHRLTRSLVVLSRAAGRSEPLRELVRDLLDERLKELVERLRATTDPDLAVAIHLVVAETRPVVGAVDAQYVLQEIRSATEGRLAIELGFTAVDGLRAMVDVEPDLFRPSLAAAQAMLSDALSIVGSPTPAVSLIDDSVETFRTLARTDPARYLPDLAWALGGQSTLYAHVGRPADALAPIDESVRIRRALAEADAATHLPNLATALESQSIRLAQAGRPAEGLALGDDAIKIRRTLADADRARYLPDLAAALSNQAENLRRAGRHADGLVLVNEAVGLYRALAAADPSRFLHTLAISLNNQSILLASAGHSADGLPPIDEAVTTYRALAQTDPGRFLPDLAIMLNNQSNRRADAARSAEGVASIDEAVAIFRELAETDPLRFLPDLAMTLGTQSNRLAEIGRTADCLPPIYEAVEIRRQLAEADPTSFLPGLALSLNGLSNRLAQAGRSADGLVVVDEAVTAFRTLARTDSTRFLPELAGALTNLANRLGEAGRSDDALASIDEAVGLYRTLAQENRIRQLADLAMALNNQSNHLADAGRPADALAPIDEAVTTYRALARVDPTRFLADLATGLNNQSNHLANAGRPADGLLLIDEAITIRRTLALANPVRFLPDLGGSLVNQSNLLAALDRHADVNAVYDVVLAEHPDSPWARGVILFGRAHWRAANERYDEAAADGVEAANLLDAANDTQRRGQAHRLLRILRIHHPTAVDAAWLSGDDALPVWLLIPTIDSDVERRLLEWVAMTTWTETLDRLAADADHLLTDRAEASFHHLIETNPYNPELEQHLAILLAARAEGIDAVREAVLRQVVAAELDRLLDEWIATPDWSTSAEYLTEHRAGLLTDDAESALAAMTVDNPNLLGYLGLLGAARALGIDEAHCLVDDPDRLPAALEAADITLRLALARLAAGPGHAGPADHLTHALAALDAGAADEAEWAVVRCRDSSPTWEIPSLVARLDEYALAHPDCDVTPLRTALLVPQS